MEIVCQDENKLQLEYWILFLTKYTLIIFSKKRKMHPFMTITSSDLNFFFV